ncbi:MAG: S-layer homology domain-containing protein, partial [Clostridia bacterium]|nr:S-layer homology domain-containing protein [Clostridia bacterium]
MRKAKRILAFMLAVMMMATCMGSVVFAEETSAETKPLTGTKAATFSDVAENAPYRQAVYLLNLMGIINGYPDGTFGPDKNVTRAEFTAMLMRTLNYGGIGAASAAKLPFSDVKDDDSSISWAIPDINTAYAKGIINGYEDGTFRPSANVAYEEAIKMIVYTLGYVMDVSGTPWYGEYVAQANKLGITDVANKLGAVETPASRACIAQMLFDSLEVELVEGNQLLKKTILADYLGYVRDRGIVTSNGSVSLVAPDIALRDNEIQIGSRD